ncbi:hypothetical protein [Pararhizobium mangrovi]|uniref:Uncharacterized protein n=1 Tax=Pararhizobium mangrovi TaxID=2590452 RepID=A0A506UCZ7_9HYPH|nr:hypothetical protein [Pararhizobium mangrovi]TPW29617.1 hypothetical protein FJU11_07200 [Pararhizobium mangrovi]
MLKGIFKSPRNPLSVLFILFSLAIIINIVEFPFIERDSRHNYSAVYKYRYQNVIRVAIDHDNSSRTAVAPYYYLGLVFPESVVVMPTDDRLADSVSIRSFGLASEIRYRDYDPVKLFEKTNIKPHLWNLMQLADDRGNVERVIEKTFGIATSNQPSGTFVILHDRSGRFYYVDSNLLDAQTRKDLGIG